MKPLLDLTLNDYNELVVQFHKESDRAAAVLAGAFVENFLAAFLKKCHLIDDPETDSLFSGFGPLASFSQRITMGYAMGVIDKVMKADLLAIKEIRNHFAHHPLDATFDDKVLDKHFIRLSSNKYSAATDKPLTRRELFLFAVAYFAGQAGMAIANKEHSDSQADLEADSPRDAPPSA